MLLLHGAVSAKSLYVNNSETPACSDSTTYADNTSASPWCSIGRAAWGSTDRSAPNTSQAAQAGDTVYITAGTYSTAGTNIAHGIAYQPANSGTISSPIRFEAVGTVILTLSSSAGPVIGTNGESYIQWDGFTIDEANAPSVRDTGSVVLWDSVGSVIEGCTIDGNGTVAIADNHTGIRLERTLNALVRNNKIYQVYSNNTDSHNGAGIMMYDTEAAVIEHNEIYETGAGIYVKGEHADDGWPQQNNIIRYNIFRDNNSKGVFVYDGVGTKIYQNLFIDSQNNVQFYGSAVLDDVYLVNNTFISNNVSSTDNGYSAYGSMASASNVVIHNNIFYGSLSEALSMGELSALGDQSFEHNVYYGYDTFGSLNLGTFSFSTWRSTYGQDAESPESITNDPLFEGFAEGDYTLASGSPALALGRTLTAIHGSSGTAIAAGAYITGNEVIGIGVGNLSAPSGFEIITQ